MKIIDINCVGECSLADYISVIFGLLYFIFLCLLLIVAIGGTFYFIFRLIKNMFKKDDS
jgi:hypothetical protein